MTTPYLEDEFDHPQASLSPDGSFLAYVSNETSACLTGTTSWTSLLMKK